MAKLSSFKRDSKAITEGEWVRVGDEYDDLEIHTRGITDAYTNAQAARQRKAAIGFGGDVEKLPIEIRRQINTDLLIKHVLIDVRNLEDNGNPVTFEQFCDMLRDPDYTELVGACFKAALMVGQRRGADLEEAVGN